MKLKLKALLASLVLLPALAWGQVTPVIPNNTVLGNSSGSTGAPTALTALPLTVQTNGSVYVTNSPYNAKCDGSTDDTAAIQLAVNHFSGGQGNVRLPDNSTCKITYTVAVPYSGVRIIGGGYSSTQIQFNPSITLSGLAATNTAGAFSCTTCAGIAVGETITLSGSAGGTGSISGYANPTTYYVSAATNGTPGSLTLKALPASTLTAPTALVTTVGTVTMTPALASVSAFRFGLGQGAEIFRQALIGVAFTSSDTTFTKTAVELIDTGGFVLQDVYVSLGGAGQWTGGAAVFPDTQAGSIGLRTRGRDAGNVTDFFSYADRHIVISPNPDSSIFSLDHFNFHNFYPGSGTISSPNVWVDSGVTWTNNSFDGRQAWVGGTYGVYYNDTTSIAASYNNAFYNVRWEQATNSAGYLGYFASTVSQLQSFTFNNSRVATGTTSGGIFCRSCFNFYADTFTYNQAGVAFNFDSTDFNTEWKNANLNSSATISMTTQTLLQATYLFNSATIPADAVWGNTTVGQPSTIAGATLAVSAQAYSQQPFWGVNGFGFSVGAETLRDTTSTGTIAKEALHAFGVGSLASTNAGVTVTNIDNLYIAAPLASTNVTGTYLWSLDTAGGILDGGPLVSGGTVFNIASGTGACATSGSKNGGVQSGDFQCTGTTGASTITLTLAATIKAYSCWGRDITTPTTVTQTGAKSTTSVTLTLTSVAANDVIQFGCLGY